MHRASGCIAWGRAVNGTFPMRPNGQPVATIQTSAFWPNGRFAYEELLNNVNL